MQIIIDEISKIEREAKRLDIPFVKICRKAKVNNSTTQRWRSGETTPRFNKWQDFTNAFELLKRKKQKVRNA